MTRSGGGASWADRAFAARGPLLASLALLALPSARPDRGSLLLGALLCAPPLLLRAWAFAHLGGAGRTRSPEAPPERVRSGPYRLLDHPVYVANVLLAGAMLQAARPPGSVAALLAVALVAFYGVLARREGAQWAGRPSAARAAAWARVPRWERSTWATTGLWFLVLALLPA